MPDLVGSLLVALGIGAVALALVKGPTWGWTSTRDLTTFAVGLVSVVGFWVRSERHPLPVVEPALLRVRAFTWANVTAVLFNIAFAGALLTRQVSSRSPRPGLHDLTDVEDFQRN